MGNAVENSAVKDKKILIIGGGLGGLFTGALLAKNGAIVRVLEKNVIIGGGLQCFSRNGKSFETGMHIVGGFRPGGTLYKLSSYLGILDRLQLEHLDGEYADTIYFADNNLSFRLPSGRDNFTKALISYFPDEEEGIKGYIDAIFRLSDLLPLYNLRERCDYLINPPEEFVMPADTLIAKYVSDPTLRALLAYHNSLYDGVKEETPAFIHAVINTLYITGQSRFVGGSQQLASALAGDVSGLKNSEEDQFNGVVYFMDKPYNNIKGDSIGPVINGIVKLDKLEGVSYDTFRVNYGVLDLRGRDDLGHNPLKGYNIKTDSKKSISYTGHKAIYFTEKYIDNIEGIDINSSSIEEIFETLARRVKRVGEGGTPVYNVYVGDDRYDSITDKIGGLDIERHAVSKTPRTLEEFEYYANYGEVENPNGLPYQGKFKTPAYDSYNDDFIGVDTIIKQKLEKDKDSGLNQIP